VAYLLAEELRELAAGDRLKIRNRGERSTKRSVPLQLFKAIRPQFGERR
jgi:hypothetical protein